MNSTSGPVRDGDEELGAPVDAVPRILTLMGSGETSPTMVKTHRDILRRLDAQAGPVVLLDTPFGFQENAREIAARVESYFQESLQTRIDVASGLLDADSTTDSPFAKEQLTARLRDARYVFSGPGSPTYALRRWTGSVVPGLLVEKLAHGGAVTFSSAAALTLGAFTVPVYEIYKAGEDPHWLDGLDVLGSVGLDVAVVPHFNNAEGGTHDTRFCYLGERRLAVMEKMLPPSHVVLGVDEHTACVIDLVARTATVAGLGVVTVRKLGRSVTFAAGSEVPLDDLLAAADDTPLLGSILAARDVGQGPAAQPGSSEAGSPVPRLPVSPLLDLVRSHEADFADAVAARDASRAVAAVLGVEQLIVDWSTDIPQADELERARASLRTMIVELGQLANDGLRDPRAVVGPFVDALVELRRVAREQKRFADADAVRELLTSLGVELRDGAAGTEWLLAPDPAQR